MGISENINYKLKEDDVALLQKLNRIEAYDKLKHSLGRKPTMNEMESKAITKLISFGKIKTIEELLAKYAFWEPAYLKDTTVFSFGVPIPVEVFYAFRLDAEKFPHKDIIVIGQDTEYGYRKWKQ